MDSLTIPLLELILLTLTCGTWWFLRKDLRCAGWREWASFTALALASAALTMELLIAVPLFSGTIGRLIEEKPPSIGWFLVGLVCAPGLLAATGLISAMIGSGKLRKAAGVWSVVAGGAFFVHALILINSFH